MRWIKKLLKPAIAWLVTMIMVRGFYFVSPVSGNHTNILDSSPDNIRPGHELRNALLECKSLIISVIFLSMLSNMLMLVGPFYMLEVYDRVLPSGSIPSLVALSLIAFTLFLAQGFFDFIRSRILIRMGNHIEERLIGKIFVLVSRASSINRLNSDANQAQKHVDSIKSFFSSGGLVSMLDLPWIPLFIGIMFLLHWLLGAVALVGGLILIGIAVYSERRTLVPVKLLGTKLTIKANFLSAVRRNSDVIASMGFRPSLAEVYRGQAQEVRDTQTLLSDMAGGLGTISRTLRLALQSGILGIGALLVIRNEASAGIIIAGSILFGRALAPVDQAISNWRNLVSAREGWQSLEKALDEYYQCPSKMMLPQPKDSVCVDNLSFVDLHSQRFLLRDITFTLKSGDTLCIIGPSGAGKSTLSRLLVNAWSPTTGRVMLDGAALDQWPAPDLGNHIGFLPQDIELFSGSIAQNIARFQKNIDPDKVISAASQAGIHDLVLKMKDGYQTQIGEGGSFISAGQRQRIALARAIYGDPFLVVLDEPNSNLDAEGDNALLTAVRKIQKRGGVIVAVSHRPSLLEVFDNILLLREGRMIACGPKKEIIQQYLTSPTAASRTFKPAEKTTK